MASTPIETVDGSGMVEIDSIDRWERGSDGSWKAVLSSTGIPPLLGRLFLLQVCSDGDIVCCVAVVILYDVQYSLYNW